MLFASLHFCCALELRVFAARESLLAEGRKSFGWTQLSAHVSGPICLGNVSRRTRKKKSSLQGPYFFVSLTSFEVTRICKMSQAPMKGQSASKGGSIGFLYVENCSSCCFKTRAQHTRAAFLQSWLAAFFHQCIPVTLPVLGLQMQLHQRPSHDMKPPELTSQIHMKLAMQFACAFLCLSAFAAGRDVCAAFPLQLHEPPVQENKEPEMVVGTVVACDGVNHALTCHLTSDSLVLAANRTASSIPDVH